MGFAKDQRAAVGNTITFELDEEESRRLLAVASELRIDPIQLAKATINDLVSRPADDFDRAARHVLEKNRELYKRLS